MNMFLKVLASIALVVIMVISGLTYNKLVANIPTQIPVSACFSKSTNSLVNQVMQSAFDSVAYSDLSNYSNVMKKYPTVSSMSKLFVITHANEFVLGVDHNNGSIKCGTDYRVTDTNTGGSTSYVGDFRIYQASKGNQYIEIGGLNPEKLYLKFKQKVENSNN